jgi:hypothetical protein
MAGSLLPAIRSQRDTLAHLEAEEFRRGVRNMENNFRPGSLEYDIVAAKNRINEIANDPVLDAAYKEKETARQQADIIKFEGEIAARAKLIDQSRSHA